MELPIVPLQKEVTVSQLKPFFSKSVILVSFKFTTALLVVAASFLLGVQQYTSYAANIPTSPNNGAGSSLNPGTSPIPGIGLSPNRGTNTTPAPGTGPNQGTNSSPISFSPNRGTGNAPATGSNPNRGTNPTPLRSNAPVTGNAPAGNNPGVGSGPALGNGAYPYGYGYGAYPCYTTTSSQVVVVHISTSHVAEN